MGVLKEAVLCVFTRASNERNYSLKPSKKWSKVSFLHLQSVFTRSLPIGGGGGGGGGGLGKSNG